MKCRIPRANRDVIRLVRWRRFRRIAGYLLWLAAFAFGAWFYNDSHQTYPPERRIVGLRLVLWMLVGAITGFVVFQIWRFMFHRTVEGHILEAAISHSYTPSADPGTVKSLNYDFRDNTYLVIRTDKGKKRRIRFEQKPGFYLYYYPGSYLCRFAELPYPICDPNRQCKPEGEEIPSARKHHDDLSNGRMCAVCGFLNRGQESCDCCGLSLIDPNEIWDKNENERITNRNV